MTRNIDVGENVDIDIAVDVDIVVDVGYMDRDEGIAT